MTTPKTKAKDLAQAIVKRDRRALARAITLVESERADHREEADALLAKLSEHSGNALRIGLSGTPGVGKSTFIEAFGMMLTAQDLRVAVLAVDPSSARSGGSILGDKTRMEHLVREPNAFIRPSPSKTQMGGVAQRTRDVMHLCEAAQFDVILIETVGVGQSETQVAQLCDVFLLLMAPAGGDELQGVKRGIMEMADMILVNKADGDLKPAAMRTCSDYAGAVRLLRRRPQDPDNFPKAVTVSATTGLGLEAAWEDIKSLFAWRKDQGHLDPMRRAQERYWLHETVRSMLLSRLQTPSAQAKLTQLEEAIKTGEISSAQAARHMVEFLHHTDAVK